MVTKWPTISSYTCYLFRGVGIIIEAGCKNDLSSFIEQKLLTDGRIIGFGKKSTSSSTEAGERSPAVRAGLRPAVVEAKATSTALGKGIKGMGKAKEDEEIVGLTLAESTDEHGIIDVGS